MAVQKILLYFHTIRHLRFEQIWYRLWRFVWRPKFDESTPSLTVSPGAIDAWVASVGREPTVISSGQFRFLSVRGALAEIGWDGPEVDKLWRYNQHYFDDLNAKGAEGRTDFHVHLIADWMSKNPAPPGTGWEPYPLSLRIVNWVKWCLRGNASSKRIRDSLSLQARWLAGNIEYHLLGNHLVSNAKALVFAGCFFAGSEADHWRRIGLEILRRELDEQILDDGGNFERSPMYHALGLEDVLDLINLAAVYPALLEPAQVANWRGKAGRMLSWLHAMTHPDGQIAMFNDSALDIALQPLDLTNYARDLDIPERAHRRFGVGISITHLYQSGYIRIETPDACAILDVAPLGPDYLPAHGHADTLSFELSLFGQRIVVNGGTSCYGTSVVRALERGTAAHSTVTINGLDSSEVWGGFRVARRAYPFGLEISESEDFAIIACSHDGYRRLKGAPNHRRSWKMGANTIEIADIVWGGHTNAASQFLLHHSIVVSQKSEQNFELRTPSGNNIRLEVLEGQCKVRPAYHAVRFGDKLPTTSILVDLIQVDPVLATSRVRLSW